MHKLSKAASGVLRYVGRSIESQTLRNVLSSKALVALSMVLVFGVAGFAAPVVEADRYDDQIRALQNENATNGAALGELRAEANSLEATIAALRSQIAALEAQIRDNQAKRDDLHHKINAAEAEMAEQKRILGINIRKMYLEDQMTTGEMLATSKDLGEFVDREQYRLTIQAQIKKTLDRIEELKAELEEQRSLVEKLLQDQQAMQSELAAQRAETNRLLALNRAQRAEFEREISNNNSRMAELRRQQAAENAKHVIGSVSYAGTGSYPWANVPFPNAMPDPWGMYKRQCVSYTAWKVASTGRHMPYWGGRGNANLWDDNARAAGIPVDTNPRVGDVAVSHAGYYGHTMYVEEVYGNGTIRISQYNGAWDGRYSEAVRSTAGLVFIHFP